MQRSIGIILTFWHLLLFPKSSVVARDAVVAITQAIADVVSPAPYIFVMTILKSCINDHGCRGAVVEPQLFSPLDYWLRRSVIDVDPPLDYNKYMHSTHTVAVSCFFFPEHRRKIWSVYAWERQLVC